MKREKLIELVDFFVIYPGYLLPSTGSTFSSSNVLDCVKPGFDLSVIVERFLFGTTTYYFRSRERIVYTYTKNVRF